MHRHTHTHTHTHAHTHTKGFTYSNKLTELESNAEDVPDFKKAITNGEAQRRNVLEALSSTGFLASLIFCILNVSLHFTIDSNSYSYGF